MGQMDGGMHGVGTTGLGSDISESQQICGGGGIPKSQSLSLDLDSHCLGLIKGPIASFCLPPPPHPRLLRTLVLLFMFPVIFLVILGPWQFIFLC